jgi:CheY-like chemotaxis protein
MPELGGADFHALLGAAHSEMAARFVAMTGGALSDHALQFVEHGGVTVLRKPIDPRTLRKLVADRLGG